MLTCPFLDHISVRMELIISAYDVYVDLFSFGSTDRRTLSSPCKSPGPPNLADLLLLFERLEEPSSPIKNFILQLHS